MKPVLHKFRSAVFGGFNRRDVLDYIELSAQETNKKVYDLNGRLKLTERERDMLAAELEGLRNESGGLAEQEVKMRESLEESTRSLTAVRGELQATRAQLAAAKKELAGLQSKVAEIEPVARRYEALKDRVATVELDAHQKAQATMDKAQAECGALRADTARWMGEVQSGYDKLRTQMKESAAAVTRVEEAFAALDEEYQALLSRGLAFSKLEFGGEN